MKIIEMINETKNEIKMLEENSKDIEKRIKDLTEQLDNNKKDIINYKKILEAIENVRNDEINATLMNIPEKRKKLIEKRRMTGVKYGAFDQNGVMIAEYKSASMAARDINVSPSTIFNRASMTEEVQLKKYGYVLKEL